MGLLPKLLSQGDHMADIDMTEEHVLRLADGRLLACCRWNEHGTHPVLFCYGEKRMLREHGEMMLSDHRQTLWAHFANVALGA